MGARGPLPADMPVNVRRLKADAGTLGSEVGRKARVSRPVPSSPLSDREQAHFDRTIGDLEPIGLLASSDAGLLTQWARAAAAADELWELLRVEGLVVRNDHQGRLVKNPAWQMWRDAVGKMESVGKVLGLSPEARLRMPRVPEDDDDDDLD